MNKEITRPDFCTVVCIEEYDYIGQFDRAMKDANKFHATGKDRDCPAPYMMLDAGKAYGFFLAIKELQEKVKELEATANPL